MQYEKPIVVELNKGAMAQGGPRACINGAIVGSVYCTPGADDAACHTGGTGSEHFDGDCLAGTAPGAGEAACFTGTSAGWECASGATPLYAGTCTTGPTP